jgi:hypothetical protein
MSGQPASFLILGDFLLGSLRRTGYRIGISRIGVQPHRLIRLEPGRNYSQK